MKYMLIFLLLACSTQKHRSIIAHRGASGYLPEHTLASQAMAHAFNPDYIEPDLVLTKDNQLVVLHDIKIETTTNVAQIYPLKKRKDGHFYAIDFTLAELKKLKVNERIDIEKKIAVFENRFPLNTSKFEIPTFEETIELIQGLNLSRKKNIGIYPEIKDLDFHLEHKKDILKIFVYILKKHNLFTKEASIIVQSFDPKTLNILRNEYKAPVKLVQLIAMNEWRETKADYTKMLTLEGLKEIKSYADGIGPWIPMVLKTNLVEMAHAQNLFVHAYTARADSLPENFKTMEELYNFLFDTKKIDALFSDFPDF